MISMYQIIYIINTYRNRNIKNDTINLQKTDKDLYRYRY